MKKALVLSLMLSVAAVSFASTLAIPWYLDRANAGTGFPPSEFEASFCTIKNNVVEEPLLCAIEYFGADGSDFTPAANTFSIPANSAVGFRPCVVDKTTTGQDYIPVKVEGASQQNRAGSAAITFLGNPSDLQGRLLQVNTTGSIAMYLLPAGN